jgi:cyclic beta-1,2-glucan synthetase
MGGHQSEWTGDRREFIGRNGSLANPAALAGTGLFAGTTGAGRDACGALRRRVTLPPNGVVEIVVLLGQADQAEDARALLARYRGADCDAVLAEIARYWDGVLGAVTVKTPVRAMDIMLNGWLLYQTLACRIWARAGFYQASGAYGFRDQLQDGMALVAVRPDLTRAHLLRAAARQFEEGDVQHWWLPHSGQGVRTRISDDRAWLATAVAHYVDATGDAAVLDEPVRFLEGQLLKAEEHDAFFQPTVSDHAAPLFEHCARALDHSLATGAHGLPLIGTGDWNDGMNRVGERGEGESVWLGWFLHAALMAFAPLAEARGQSGRAAIWRTHAGALAEAIERDSWDGAWYRRGYFDDGTPLGAFASAECRIDAIAQSWAVLSGAGRPDRAAQAMGEVARQLIRPQDGVALLFALLNPINHARTRAEVLRYKVEPYVIAADVYGQPPHVGRGGWTWYTGSAGWMQRAGIETILGLRVRDGVMSLDPCIPRRWSGYELRLRHGAAIYEIVVDNAQGTGRGIVTASLDGTTRDERPLRIALVDDGGVHRVLVMLGG